MPARSVQTLFKDDTDTTRFAQKLAAALRPGDLVLLSGEIGSGKSFLARSLILSRLPAPEDIPSPTFTIVQTYQDRHGVDIWHMDLYRLSHPDELLELGLEDARENAICLIEWPEKFDIEWAEPVLWISLSEGATETERHMTLRATDERWDQFLIEFDET